MGNYTVTVQVFLAVLLFLYGGISPAYSIGNGLDISLEREVWFKVFSRHEVACSAHPMLSNVSVSFSWFMNNSRIDHRQGTTNNITEVSINNTLSKLVFANVTRDQIGYYTCVARVNQLQERASVRVNVGDIPLPLNKFTCTYNVVAGFQITFHTQYKKKDINTPIYSVFICKSTTANMWCTINDESWKRANCKNITEKDYQIRCRFSTIDPLSSNTFVIKTNARNKFGISTKQNTITPVLLEKKCIKDIKPILKVKKIPNSAGLDVRWWIRNEAKTVSHKTMMYYKKTGSEDELKKFTKTTLCTESSPCTKSLRDLLPCTNYNICVHHSTFLSSGKITCENITTDNNAFNIMVGINMRPINEAKQEVKFVWNDLKWKDKGPFYYNCTLQTTLEDESIIKRQKKVYKDTVLSFPCNMFAQGSTCKLAVKKCTNCGCGYPVPSPVESCGAKCNTLLKPGKQKEHNFGTKGQPHQVMQSNFSYVNYYCPGQVGIGETEKSFSKESIIISVLVGIFGACALLATFYGIKRYRQRKPRKDPPKTDLDDFDICPRTAQEDSDECLFEGEGNYDSVSS